MQEGRRFLSNTAYLELLERSYTPIAETTLMGVPSAKIYQLDAIFSRRDPRHRGPMN